MNLNTQQEDFTQAFPQAPLDDPIYMRMPCGPLVTMEDYNLIQSRNAMT
jgi:hypothetical protein